MVDKGCYINNAQVVIYTT